MSRVGQKPISIPSGVEVQCQGNEVRVKGPKGTLALSVVDGLAVKLEGKEVHVVRTKETETISALQGMTRSMIANMLIGVVKCYSKELEIQGVGFKAAVQGKKVMFSLGFSHPVELAIPEGLEVKVVENTKLAISGANKQLLGDFAARIKALYPAEPYKGKGVRFKGEYIKRKVGKTVA